MTNTIFGECIDIVKGLVGNEYLYFDSKVEVKTSPHTYPFAAWAVCVSPADDLYVMDADEEWHQVAPTDQKAALVIGSLYQRLRLMRMQYAKAS
jgi:hypothetical protein